MQKEASLTFDVFSIILRHVYPQTALNIFLSCKSLARYSHDTELYWFWMEKFLPSDVYEGYLARKESVPPMSLKEVKDAFAHHWKMGYYIELYDAESIYDIERIVSMRFVSTIVKGEPKRRVIVLSRLPSLTAVKTQKRSGCIECTASDDFQYPAQVMHKIERKGLLETLAKIRKAQIMLKDKIEYYNISLDLSKIHVHNVTLLAPLQLVGKNEIMYDAGHSFTRLTFQFGRWNDVILDDKDFQFTTKQIVVLRKEGHQCNCEFAP